MMAKTYINFSYMAAARGTLRKDMVYINDKAVLRWQEHLRSAAY
jgi:hypothetical protein